MWQTLAINSKSLQNTQAWKGLYAVLAIFTVLAYGQSLNQNQPEMQSYAFPISEDLSQLETPQIDQVAAAPTFLEKGGRVKIEVESGATPTFGFKKFTFKGETGFEGEFDNFNKVLERSELIDYFIEFETPGIYRFVMNSYNIEGSEIGDKKEHNDCWFRLTNNGNFDYFGVPGPIPSESELTQKLNNCQVDWPGDINKCGGTPGGSTNNGFFKVFMGTLDKFSTDTRTGDDEPNKIYVRVKSPGTLKVTLGNRSKGHFIESFGLYKIDTWGKGYAGTLIAGSESPKKGSGGGNPPANQDPTANAGNDFSVTVGNNNQATFELNGSGSDSDGSIDAYQWKEGSNTLGNTKKVSVTKGPGTYTFTLQVTDNDGATDTDNIKVTVKAQNSDPDPDPEPEPPSNGDIAVTSFTLINAATDQEIGTLNNNDEINLQETGNQLTIVANTSGNIKKVELNLNNGQITRTERSKPYTLAGDNSGDFAPANIPLGSNKITATPFDQDNNTGNALTVNFTVVNQTPNPDPDPEPEPEPGAPSVSINTPSANQQFVKGEKMPIEATIANLGNNKVQFFKAKSLLKSFTGGDGVYNFTFNTSFQNRTPSTPTFSVKIVDGSGNVLAEDQVQVEILPEGSTPDPEPEPEPTPGDDAVTITAPAGGTTYTKGQIITISADVTSTTGTKVQFFKANSLLKTFNGGNGSFSFKFNSNFQNRTPSSPTFFVKVLDASNNVLAEDQVQVNVNPASSLSAPIIGEQSRNIQPDTQSQIEVTNLYPNVVKTNEINVVLSESVKNVTFAIRDAQGNIVKEGTFELGGTPLLKINLDQNFSSGLYFLEIKDANGTTQTRFIKE